MIPGNLLPKKMMMNLRLIKLFILFGFMLSLTTGLISARTPVIAGRGEKTSRSPVLTSNSRTRLQLAREREEEAIQMIKTRVEYQQKVTYIIFFLLFISLLGNLVLYFLLKDAQNIRNVSLQALYQLEISRKLVTEMVEQFADRFASNQKESDDI